MTEDRGTIHPDIAPHVGALQRQPAESMPPLGPRTCAEVEWDEHAALSQVSAARVGDLVWSFGKTSLEVLGHVVVRLAPCSEDPTGNWCAAVGEGPWWAAHEHRQVPMCQCGGLHEADHHWRVMRPAP